MINDRTTNWTGIVRTICDPKTSDQDRWLLRLTLLEMAKVDATPEALAFIGNTTPERAVGVMAVLHTDGLVEMDEE